MINLVVIDLDETIYKEREYLKLVFNSFEQAHDIETNSLIASFDRLDRYKCKDLLKDTLRGAGIVSQSYYDKLFGFYKGVNGILNADPIMLSFIKEARARDIPTAILTNGVPAVQRNKIKLLKASDFVDKVFIARELASGRDKPCPEIFKWVLRQFCVRPHNAVMIGDNVENDIVGAKRVGMKALHYNVCWDNRSAILKQFVNNFF